VEAIEQRGFSADPLAEASVSPVSGLLHKYRGRALLVVTGACAIHCRYCFRRHFPYGEHIADWAPALDHVAADPSIEEVILSGGDPLVLGDERLSQLAAAITRISHVRRLRIHTRLPIVLPERIDAAFVDWIGRAPRPVVVLHANHAREIDGSVARAVARLRDAGVTVLNQAVLLAGVNDSVTALVDLSKTLFEAGIMPYYLHVLDRVQGAAHFEVPEATARDLLRSASAELPGYLVPRLVKEEPGAPSKTSIDFHSP
ncbi:MAG: EF-P beta-lysylation protein EpmB, partial [Acidobacteriota bacterium]